MTPNTASGDAIQWLRVNGPEQLDLLSRTINFNVAPPTEGHPLKAQHQASYLLDAHGFIAGWSTGATRLYGYTTNEATGQHVSFLFDMPDGGNDSIRGVRITDTNSELKRAAVAGYLASERLQIVKDGSCFWANTITLALRDGERELQGFAGIVRDFSDSHKVDGKPRRSSASSAPLGLAEATAAGIVSGEYECITEANDAFLKLIGYSREDLASVSIDWRTLTPPEFSALDHLAQQEALKFGACAPYEKQLIRKDGNAVRVEVATAVLNLCPFRWITFVQDLRERNRSETIEDTSREVVEHDFSEMVGSSAQLKTILQQIEVVSPTDATVLILGETGTGKELIARAIHRMSPRRKLPMVTLNCAAIPTGLLESELFGYEKGAFTGALSQKIGRFEMAHQGTLFLDEVGDIPIDLQPKLLRALQEKSFERLGGTRTIPIDVRLVAATNRNLAQMMEDKLFRNDLYYRLNVFPITAPPLRDRSEDIPILAKHFTKKYSLKMNRQIDNIPSETMRALVNWTWPGNIRELENFIERAVILSRGPNLRAPLSEIGPSGVPSTTGLTLKQVERDHIIRVFRETGGVVTTTATRLGLHRTTLNAMMRKLRISRQDL